MIICDPLFLAQKSEDAIEVDKQVVNIRTIRNVRVIKNWEGYNGIDIINPSVLLERED